MPMVADQGDMSVSCHAFIACIIIITLLLDTQGILSYLDNVCMIMINFPLQVIGKVQTGWRLPPPPGCPRNIYHLMIECWLVNL